MHNCKINYTEVKYTATNLSSNKQMGPGVGDSFKRETLTPGENLDSVELPTPHHGYCSCCCVCVCVCVCSQLFLCCCYCCYFLYLHCQQQLAKALWTPVIHPAIQPLSCNTYITCRDIPALSGWISMKPADRSFKVRGQRSRTCGYKLILQWRRHTFQL